MPVARKLGQCLRDKVVEEEYSLERPLVGCEIQLLTGLLQNIEHVGTWVDLDFCRPGIGGYNHDVCRHTGNRRGGSGSVRAWRQWLAGS